MDVLRQLKPKQRAFLKAYATCGSITKAARLAKCDRQVHYHSMQVDEAYKVAFAVAKEQASEALEDEAVRRAHEGIETPVVHLGQLQYPQLRDEKGNLVVGEDGKPVYSGTPLTLREYSDTLLIFLLKGMKPEKFRDNVKAELSGPGGGAIQMETSVAVTLASKLTPDELTSLKQKLEA